MFTYIILVSMVLIKLNHITNSQAKSELNLLGKDEYCKNHPACHLEKQIQVTDVEIELVVLCMYCTMCLIQLFSCFEEH